MADSLTPITSDQLSKVTTAKDTDLVTLGINGNFVSMTLANLKEVLGINALNTNIVVHTYTAHFSGGNATVLRIKNGLQVISVQNYLGEMSNATIIRYWVYKDEGNDWIKIYIDQNYTGNVGIKIVGCMSCSAEPL